MSEAEPPREGLEGSLPPCLKIAVYGGRAAWLNTPSKCGTHGSGCPFKFHIVVSPIDLWGTTRYHSGRFPLSRPASREFQECTDDSDKAEMLWVQAQELLRTGELE